MRVRGCDNTSVNTGTKGGLIFCFERSIKHPVHWAGCLMHLIELPLKAALTKFTGGTSGSSSFKGELGKMIQKIDEINQFAKFSGLYK